MEQIIYRWDLDKTYIKTDFETLTGLFKTALEKAEQKKSVPGAPSLLKELQKNETNEIYFISGSPLQMRKVLEKKLVIDGIRWKQLVLKPNLRNLLLGRFHALKEQIGYKLPILLEDNLKKGRGSEEILFGDDAESDAYIYSLYADTIAGKVKKETIQKIMELSHVPAKNQKQISGILEHLAHADVVKKIFIYLDKKSPTKQFDHYGSRLVPIYNYFQAALVLYNEGLITLTSLTRIILDLVFEAQYSPVIFSNSFQDLQRRGVLNSMQSAKIVDGIKENLNEKIIPLPEGFYEKLFTHLDALKDIKKNIAIDSLKPVDYVKLYLREHEKRIKRKKSMIDRILQ
jgi:hypothetical protein